MIDGIPNLPLYFYQKDIIGSMRWYRDEHIAMRSCDDFAGQVVGWPAIEAHQTE